MSSIGTKNFTGATLASSSNMPPSGKAEPTLLGVPPEIFEHVAEHVSNAELLALRLTNRTAASRVLRTYTRAHFSCRNIYLHLEDDLLRAIEIADHPIFGPALRQLTVNLDRIGGQSFICKTELFLKDEVELQARLKLYRARQDYFRESAKDVELLKVLFSKLHGNALHPRIIISRRRVILEQRLDPKGIIKRGGLIISPSWEDKRPFKVLMEALALSKLQISSLKNDSRGGSLCPDELNQDQVESMRLSLQMVSHLCLNLRTPWTSWGKDSKRRVRFCEMLQLLPILSSLVLFTAWDNFHERTGDFLGSLFQLDRPFPSLKVLTLQGHACSVHALRRFIKLNTSLERLVLSDIVFYEASTDFLQGGQGEELDVGLKRLTHLSTVEIGRNIHWDEDRSH